MSHTAFLFRCNWTAMTAVSDILLCLACHLERAHVRVQLCGNVWMREREVRRLIERLPILGVCWQTNSPHAELHDSGRVEKGPYFSQYFLSYICSQGGTVWMILGCREAPSFPEGNLHYIGDHHSPRQKLVSQPSWMWGEVYLRIAKLVLDCWTSLDWLDCMKNICRQDCPR